MNKKLFIDALGWGFLVWLAGYILGIIFFAFIPPALIGWAIMPFGIIIALLVLFKKINSTSISYYLIISVSWTAIAIILDYFLLVKLFKPADGYYKLDVYLYYILTFVSPLFVGLFKSKKSPS